MPITPSIRLTRVSQEEFRHLSYDVMEHVFAVEDLHPTHRSQTIHYLILFDLAHAKLTNLRTEKVQHEFVNCHQRLGQLRRPHFEDRDWDSTVPGAKHFRDTLTALLQDWGTGLDLGLYEEAITHFFGGEEAMLAKVPLFGTRGHLHDQTMKLAAPDVAFKLTGISDHEHALLVHTRSLISHTPLKAILWANIRNHHVTFTTIRP